MSERSERIVNAGMSERSERIVKAGIMPAPPYRGFVTEVTA
jgi:hypothetical protein